MTELADIHHSGFNCCETIIAKYNEDHGTDIPIAIGTGMGGGMGAGSTCGSIVGAAIVMGFLRGRSKPKDPDKVRALTSQLLKAVRAKYGSEQCLDLKRNKVSCDEIIAFSYKTLNDILENQNLK